MFKDQNKEVFMTSNCKLVQHHGSWFNFQLISVLSIHKIFLFIFISQKIQRLTELFSAELFQL